MSHTPGCLTKRPGRGGKSDLFLLGKFSPERLVVSLNFIGASALDCSYENMCASMCTSILYIYIYTYCSLKWIKYIDIYFQNMMQLP